MVLEGAGKYHKSEASRAIIYVSQKLASDSAFPFTHKDDLRIVIDVKGKRLIIEKA